MELLGPSAPLAALAITTLVGLVVGPVGASAQPAAGDAATPATSASQRARESAESRESAVASDPTGPSTSSTASGSSREAQATADDPAERAEEAARKAEEAARDAWQSARALEQRERAERESRRRGGPYVGGGVFYAAEQFDDGGLVVRSSFGGAAWVGWALDSMFSVEVRYEGLDEFEIEAANGRAEIEGHAFTANVRIMPFEGPLRPYASFGGGAVRIEERVVLDDGSRGRFQEDGGAFRVAGGFELPVNAHLALSAEAAYLGTTGDVSGFDTLLIGTGLRYRF